MSRLCSHGGRGHASLSLDGVITQARRDFEDPRKDVEMSGVEWTSAIRPSGELYLAPLSPGSELEAWHAPVEFQRWEQPAGAPKLTREETYGGKAQIIGSDGTRSVGEVELVQRLRMAGYRAFWIDAFGSAPENWRKYIATRDQLPLHVAELFVKVKGSSRGKQGGSPDVVAWDVRTLHMYFVEYKGPKDKVRPGQDAWFRSALRNGVAPTAYVVAKWGA
jgi:hypothetical protein